MFATAEAVIACGVGLLAIIAGITAFVRWLEKKGRDEEAKRALVEKLTGDLGSLKEEVEDLKEAFHSEEVGIAELKQKLEALAATHLDLNDDVKTIIKLMMERGV